MSIIKKCLIAISISVTTSSLFAQNYPNRPVKIVVGYSAGGAVDTVARTIGQSLSSSLGQQFIIENKPGGATNIAVKQVIESPADGYTLMLAANALAANMALFKPAPFDAEKDLVAISLIGRVPVVIAAPANSKLNSLDDLIRQAKRMPDQITYGSPGNGATPHMALKFFEQAAKISLKHIPYKGGTQAITDLIGGQLDLVALNALEVSPHVKSGKMKVLAVMSAGRSPIYPDVPTIAESGFPGFEASVWYGLVAPAGTPTPVVERLHQEVQKALNTKEVRERLMAVGGEVNPGPQNQFRNLLRSERQRYEKLVREANIQPD